MARVLVDTSAVYAVLDRSDARHAAAKESLENLRKARSEPLLTNFIVAECHALALARLGADVARRWLLSNVWAVERVTENDEATARETIRKYSDKSFSYTDATSFAVMERLRIGAAFTFDRNFAQYGLLVVSPQSGT